MLAITAALTGCAWQRGTNARLAADARLNDAADYLKQDMPDSALAAFALALESNPRLVQAHLGMGDIWKSKGDYPSATRSYEQAVRIAPGSFAAQYGLGLVLQLDGKVEESIRPYLQALTIDPHSAAANRNLASAYLQLNRPSDALPYARRAAQLATEDQAAWANLGAVLSLLGRYDEAIDAYRNAVELGEMAEPILLGLAEAHLKMGHYDRAMATLEALVRRAPSAAAYERMGLTRFKQRFYEQALANYRQALTLAPEDTASLNGVGACLMTMYIQSGMKDQSVREQALEAWRKSLQLNLDQPRIIDLLSRYQRL